ncbi:MAG TPA: hypothetical protein VFY40_01075, partial [Blastocatellia bacterium]|nr:hypothetical protein [Blastocatellia bacterium]
GLATEAQRHREKRDRERSKENAALRPFHFSLCVSVPPWLAIHMKTAVSGSLAAEKYQLPYALMPLGADILVCIYLTH